MKLFFSSLTWTLYCACFIKLKLFYPTTYALFIVAYICICSTFNLNLIYIYIIEVIAFASIY